MNANESVLRQFRAANADERLNLYVFHRDLREAFSQIDLECDGAWGEEEAITLEMPTLGGLLAALIKAIRASNPKQNAPVPVRTDALTQSVNR